MLTHADTGGDSSAALVSMFAKTSYLSEIHGRPVHLHPRAARQEVCAAVSRHRRRRRTLQQVRQHTAYAIRQHRAYARVIDAVAHFNRLRMLAYALC